MAVLTKKCARYSKKQKSHLFENSAFANLFASLVSDGLLDELMLVKKCFIYNPKNVFRGAFDALYKAVLMKNRYVCYKNIKTGGGKNQLVVCRVFAKKHVTLRSDYKSD